MGEGKATAETMATMSSLLSIDTIVMGRKTFEKVLTFDKWYYGGKRVMVLSNHPSTCLSLGTAEASLS